MTNAAQTDDPNDLVTFPWLYGTTEESPTRTTSERIRQQDAPTEPPRFAAYDVTDGEACHQAPREDDPEALLSRIGRERAWADKFGTHEILVVDRDRSPADVYAVDVTLTDEGAVISEPRHLRTVKWCAACECAGHTIRECVDEDEGAAPETEAEALGLGMGAR